MLKLLRTRTKALLSKKSLDSDMEEEMRAHVEERTQANIEAGMNPEEARFAALRQFGWADSIKEECRDQRGVRWIEDLLLDLRFAFRQLLKSPGFTAIAVLTLALGIGSTTAFFSVVDKALIHPLPATAGPRLVQIAERLITRGGFASDNDKPFFHGVAPPGLQALLGMKDCLEEVTWVQGVQLDWSSGEFSETAFGAGVPPRFFETMGVRPSLGRSFARDEAVPVTESGDPRQDAVMVLSHAGWQGLLGGDPNVLGRQISMGGRRFTIVGVAPPHFRFPEGGTQFWFPAEPMAAHPEWGTGANIRVFARLREGLTMAQLQARLDGAANRLKADAPKSYASEWSARPGGFGFWARPADAMFTDRQADLRQTLLGLFGAILFVLLIVCANVANLTLIRTEKRRQELAIRAALGAGRLRLLRLLLSEGVVVSLCGGLLGLIGAYWGIKILSSLIPDYTPRMREIRMDGHVLAITMMVSLLTGLGLGAIAAFRSGGAALGDTLKRAGGKTTASATTRRFQGGLVVAELALTMILLTGAGLMIQSVANLLRVDTGFDPENLVKATLNLPWETYNDPGHYAQASQLRKNVFATLRERLAGLPGVSSVGIGKHGCWPVKVELAEGRPTMEVQLDGTEAGAGDFLRTIRATLLSGRLLEDRDAGLGNPAVVVNQTMAKTCWPDTDPVGRRFRSGSGENTLHFEVVGVVADVRDTGFDQQPRPTFYRPTHESNLEGLPPFVVLRTRQDPKSLLAPFLKELTAVEPRLKKPDVSFCRETLRESTMARRTYMNFLNAFAAMGLVLSALGIYGVLGYSVARRTQEIGIRIALGAEGRHVLTMVLGEGTRLIAVGLVIGLLSAFWLTKLIEHHLFAVGPTEPFAFLGAALLLSLVALAACWIPARRATKVNPMETLRTD